MTSPDGMPADIAAMLREIGPGIEVPRTAAAYAQMHPVRPFADVVLHADLGYGPHERHVLDVFTAPEPGAGKPVLVFVHGGGFAGGTKHADGSPFYDNICRWAALNGMVGVQITYRLAPEFPFPAGVEDLEAVLDWLKANIADHGGDPGAIVLWGHSAGASHVADYISAHAGAPDPALAGAVLMSGFYDLGDRPSRWSAYYGEDPSKYAGMAALPGLVTSGVPLLIVDAELDLPESSQQAEMLAAALAAAEKPVRRVHLDNHNHISEAYAVGAADASLAAPVKAFVMEAAAR